MSNSLTRFRLETATAGLVDTSRRRCSCISCDYGLLTLTACNFWQWFQGSIASLFAPGCFCCCCCCCRQCGMIQDRQHGHNLRSATTTLCRTSTTTTFAKRTFRCSAPLSGTHYRKLFSVVFKSRPKTFVFFPTFSSSSAHCYTAWPQRLWSHVCMALYKSV